MPLAILRKLFVSPCSFIIGVEKSGQWISDRHRLVIGQIFDMFGCFIFIEQFISPSTEQITNNAKINWGNAQSPAHG